MNIIKTFLRLALTVDLYIFVIQVEGKKQWNNIHGDDDFHLDHYNEEQHEIRWNRRRGDEATFLSITKDNQFTPIPEDEPEPGTFMEVDFKNGILPTFVCVKPGHFLDPKGDCRVYFKCSPDPGFFGAFHTYKYTCAAEHYYNPQKKSCKKILQTDCKNHDKLCKCPDFLSPNEMASTELPPPPPPTADWCEIPMLVLDEHSIESGNSKDFSCTFPGLFPVPNNCTFYYNCSVTQNNGFIIQKFQCHKGCYFDRNANKCQLFLSDECKYSDCECPNDAVTLTLMEPPQLSHLPPPPAPQLSPLPPHPDPQLSPLPPHPDPQLSPLPPPLDPQLSHLPPPLDPQLSHLPPHPDPQLSPLPPPPAPQLSHLPPHPDPQLSPLPPHPDPQLSLLPPPPDSQLSRLPPPLDPQLSHLPPPLDPQLSHLPPPLDPQLSHLPPPLDPQLSHLPPPADPQLSHLPPPLDPQLSHLPPPADPQLSHLPPPADPQLSHLHPPLDPQLSHLPPPADPQLSHLPPPPDSQLSHLPPPPDSQLSHLPPPPDSQLSHLPPASLASNPLPNAETIPKANVEPVYTEKFTPHPEIVQTEPALHIQVAVTEKPTINLETSSTPTSTIGVDITTTTTSTSIIEPEIVDGVCMKVGKYLDIQDCGSYYHCPHVASNAELKQCTTGLFDAEEMECTPENDPNELEGIYLL